MPRIARAVAPGYPHHITQRGNNHVHLLAIPRDEAGLARGIGLTNLLYTQCLNGKIGSAAWPAFTGWSTETAKAREIGEVSLIFPWENGIR